MAMTVKKRKDGEAGQVLHMKLNIVDCGDWTSCVVQGTDEPEAEMSPREQVLAALTGECQTTKELELIKGLPNTTVDREAKALVRAGQALTSKAGKNNANAYRLP